MTLNQTIARLRLLALSHKQINQFEFDNVLEWFDGGDVTYPACLVDLNTANVSTASHTTSFPFEIWFADLVNVNDQAKSNETEVMSDLTSIAEDYISLINDPEFDDDWTIESVSALTYYKEKFTDWTLAIKVNITISTNFLNDRCQVPATDLVFVDPIETDMNIYDIVYIASGTEGSEIEVLDYQELRDIKDKKIVLFIRSTEPLRVVSGVPAIGEYQFNGSKITLPVDLVGGEKLVILYRNF